MEQESYEDGNGMLQPRYYPRCGDELVEVPYMDTGTSKLVCTNGDHYDSGRLE